MTASSATMIESTSDRLISAGSTRAPAVSAGTSSVLATPRKSAPWPSGTFNSTQALPHSSWMLSTRAGKSMLSPSIRFRTIIRPRPALAASANTRRRVDLDPALGVDDDRRHVDAPHRPDRLADEIGIAGRVDRVEVLPGVIEVHHAGLDRVVVRLLFLVEIADARPVVDARRPVHRPGRR